MRQWAWLGLVLATGACAPPDPVAGGVTQVTIVSPRPDQTEIALDDDGMLRFVLAVDVDGFTFLPVGEGIDGDESMGHFHWFVNGEYQGPSGSQALDAEVAAEVDDQMQIEVRLATDDHTEIFLDGAPVSDIAEFTVTAPNTDGGSR